MSRQVSYAALRRATTSALKSLMSRALIAPKKQPAAAAQAPLPAPPGPATRGRQQGPAPPAAAGTAGPNKASPLQGVPSVPAGEQQRYFEATTMGAAVYSSALPTHLGVELYNRWAIE